MAGTVASASVPDVTVRDMFHPWQFLRRRPNIDLAWVPMVGDRLGATNGTNLIVMDPRQSQVQRRCTVAHELAHVELGHTHGCTPAEDGEARALAAQWLIPMPALLDALRWSEELEEVADELWVDVDTLYARLDELTVGERAQVAALAAEVHGGA